MLPKATLRVRSVESHFIAFSCIVIMKMAKDGLKRDKNGLRFSKDVHFILGSYGKGDGWPVYQ